MSGARTPLFGAGVRAPKEVLGLCPGCGSWQVDIDPDAIICVLEPVTEEGSVEEFLRSVTAAVLRARHEVIEDAIREHAEVCPGLKRIIVEAGIDRPVMDAGRRA